jgi:hypothetical protein
VVSQALPGQAAVVSVRTETGRLLATVAVRDAPLDRVLAALHEGLRSEVVYEVRLYRRQKGFLAWLGARPLVSLRISRVASFDLFTNRYVIEGENGAREDFGDQQAFLRRFLVLAEYPVAELDPADPQGYYLLARASLSPVRIIGPLNIVTLFSSERQLTTDWVEHALGTP